ncbi:MAG: ABC transporter ATP-binding protein [Planctomycetota bacterium]|nr:ABC transporter ATP-binding protein [Planctomycetota bacterium]
MSQPAITIENLSKRFRLGGGAAEASFRDLLAGVGRSVAGSLRLRSQHVQPHERGGDFWALCGLSAQIHRGEVVGIVGANGAGKSTLLKILSRITRPTSGRAIVRGRVASLLEVGTGFHPELTGRENIFLNATILGMTRAEVTRRFDAIVDFAGVERFLDTPVKHYSSGMSVRLAFSVAAHLDPEILIIDEVLAVGDASFQDKCLGKMRQVAAGAGRTVLFVSHNLAAVQQLCTRALLLEGGQLTDDGDPGAIVARYLATATGRGAADHADVSNLPRNGAMGSDLRFLAWRLLDADERPTQNLRFGEPLTIEVTFEARARVRNAILDLGLLTSEGAMISVLSTEHAPGPLDLPAGERVVARLRVDDLRLTPGRYRLDLAARATLASLDHLPGAGSIEVTPALFNPNVRPGYHRALLHVAPRWDIHTGGAGGDVETNAEIHRVAFNTPSPLAPRRVA